MVVTHSDDLSTKNTCLLLPTYLYRTKSKLLKGDTFWVHLCIIFIPSIFVKSSFILNYYEWQIMLVATVNTFTDLVFSFTPYSLKRGLGAPPPKCMSWSLGVHFSNPQRPKDDITLCMPTTILRMKSPKCYRTPPSSIPSWSA